MNCGSSLFYDSKEGTITARDQDRARVAGWLYFSPGDVFADRYVIIEEIGRGGMARVFKAEDKVLGIRIALKIIHPFFSANPTIINRFKQETLLTRSITHENVIRIYDIGEKDGIVFISMDYIKGQNLQELIHTSGFLAPDTAVNISRQVCRALTAAHGRGIVHRDLKPSNVMIDNQGLVTVMDFGLAKSLGSEETGPGRGFVGTAPYISPEQARGEHTDARSDIYSLGIMMYQMLAGRRPFESESQEGFLNQHLHAEPESVRNFNSQIPMSLDSLILKCLEKAPLDRFQSSQEILDELDSAIVPQPSEAEARRKPILRILSAAAAILALVIGTVFISRQITKSPDPIISGPEHRSIAVMRFVNNTGDENSGPLCRMLQEWVNHDLRQSPYLRVLSEDKLIQILQEINQLDSEEYSTDVLHRIADAGQVQYIVLGSLAGTGSPYWITVRIKEVGKEEILGSEMVQGTGTNSFTGMVDDLVQRIKDKYVFPDGIRAGDVDREVGDITTSSVEAWELYEQARKLRQARQNEDAIEALLAAIEIDPEFAMAYKLLSDTYRGIEDQKQSRKYILEALKYPDRISDRDRYMIQASVAFNVNDSRLEAIEYLKQLVNKYPWDSEGYVYLGWHYRVLEKWEQGLELFQRLIRSVDVVDRAFAAENLGFFLLSLGRYDEAREVMEQHQQIFLNQVWYYRYISTIELCVRRYDEGLAALKKGFEIEPESKINVRYKGRVRLLQGKTQEADRLYLDLIEGDDQNEAAWGRFWRACLLLTIGRYDETLQEIDKCLELCQGSGLLDQESTCLLLQGHVLKMQKKYDKYLESVNRHMEWALENNWTYDLQYSLHNRGLAYLFLGRNDDARSMAQELKAFLEKRGLEKRLRYHHHLLGKIDLAEGRSTEAVERFREALALLPHQAHEWSNHARFMFALGEALIVNGDLDEAEDVFREISLLSVGRLTWGDLYAKSYYMMGEINRVQGNRSEAGQYFRKFLTLWNDADQDVAEIEAAQHYLENVENATESISR